MSLLVDMITAGIRGIKFNPQFYEDMKYKVWICALSPATCKTCLICMVNYIYQKMLRQDFQICTKDVLARLNGLNRSKEEPLHLRVMMV